MKKILMLCGAFSLTACAELSDSFSQIRDPLFAISSRPGAMKKDVIAAAGQPLSTVPTLNGNGVCYNYTRNGGRPFYVGFNAQEQVVANGMLTCQEARQQGLLNSSELPKKRY